MTSMDLGKVVGEKGVGIASIEKTGTSGLVDTYTITYTDESTSTFTVTNGSDGSSVSVTQVLSSGTKLATLTIDGTSTDLYCNSGGSADIVTSWESTLSDEKVPSEKLTKDTLDIKADKTSGASQITDPNAHSNIGTSANATQSSINSAIDSMIGSGVSAGTFTDLQTLITNATAPSGQIPIIILDKDYKYDSTTDSSLTNGITINKNITIIGNGHIIDGNNSKRAFYINEQYTFNFNLFDLRIQNCTMDNDAGGAIKIRSNATVNINNTLFTNNTALDTYYGNGGAIFAINDATVNINNTTFNQNNATTSGGAIYTHNATITMRDSSFKNNTATNYANIYCNTVTTVYNCDINDISTTCYNVTNKPYLTDHQSIPSASTSTSGIVQLVDNLTTNDDTKALTAKQGKALADMIGQAIAYINQ